MNNGGSKGAARGWGGGGGKRQGGSGLSLQVSRRWWPATITDGSLCLRHGLVQGPGPRPSRLRLGFYCACRNCVLPHGHGTPSPCGTMCLQYSKHVPCRRSAGSASIRTVAGQDPDPPVHAHRLPNCPGITRIVYQKPHLLLAHIQHDDPRLCCFRAAPCSAPPCALFSAWLTHAPPSNSLSPRIDH